MTAPSKRTGTRVRFIDPGHDLGWHRDAACVGLGDEFYPDWGCSTRTAKRICTGCPVRRECLAYALASGERWGIWGGASERDRRRMKVPNPRQETTT